MHDKSTQAANHDFVTNVRKTIDQSDILVIGDTCQDVYYAVQEGRNIPGSTRAIDVVGLPVIEQGMASFVASQVRELGPRVKLITSGKCTIERYGDLVIRRPNTAPSERAILAGIEQHKDECHAVIVSDYNRGAITSKVMEAIDQIALNMPVFIDPGRGKADAFYGTKFRLSKRNQSELADIGQTQRSGQYSLITGGWRGMWLTNNATQKTTFIPSIDVDAIDPTGCGDVCIATICCFVLAGANMLEACRAAAVAAGLKATKQGCQPVTMQEICAVFEQWSMQEVQ